jgi:hypothetical protein
MISKQRHDPGAPLEMFTIYERPRDYPAHFVVRRFENGDPTSDFAIALDLRGARNEVPLGLVRLARHPADEPHIVEVWL